MTDSCSNMYNLDALVWASLPNKLKSRYHENETKIHVEIIKLKALSGIDIKAVRYKKKVHLCTL